MVAAIQAHSQSGHRLIVVSASKSGPEVALALTKLGPAGTRHIAAWVNIVGALQGTPLADTRALPEIENKLGQVNLAGVDSLTTKRVVNDSKLCASPHMSSWSTTSASR